MGFLRGVFAPTREKRGLSLADYEAWAAMGLTSPSAAGVSVSTEGSLRLAAVWACVRVLSQTMASLPLVVYERLDRGKRRAPDHPLWELLHNEPNPLMTSYEWRQALMGHLALWGNAYSEIEMSGAGQVVALWPLRPDRMVEVWRTGDGLRYRYELPDGERVVLSGERVFHVRGLSSDGVLGYSPIATTRQAVALGLAAEEFGARFFGNDARPGGVLQHPGVLGDQAHGRLQKSWESRHGGLARSHRVAILEEGMTYQQIGIPPEDAQFLETRKFQAEEIARVFGVPAHKVGLLDRATFSNIEHQSIEFVTDTVRPYAVQWEQAILSRLMGRGDRGRYFAEFLVDGLLRGDTVSRYQAYATGRQNGWLSANDIRELENMNPVDGGDVYLVPLNMVPAESVAGGQWSVSSEEETGDRRLETGGETRRLANGVEIRAEQWNAAAARHQLQGQYLGLWEDAAGRLVRRETNDVGNAARRLLKNGEWQAFRAWLETFYDEFGDVAARGYAPVMRLYAAQVAEQAARELGGSVPEIGAFVAAYLAEAGLRHATINLMALLGIVDELREAALEAIEASLEHQRETQPARIARHESVRAANGAAMAAYKALGANRKVWVTFGENCPYCADLGGRTVSLESFFLSAGQSLLPAGTDRPLVVNGNVGHAPAHEGCDCMIVAG